MANDSIANIDVDGLVPFGIPCPGTSSLAIFFEKVGAGVSQFANSPLARALSISIHTLQDAGMVQNAISTSNMINNAFTAVGVGIASQVSNLGGMKNEPDDKFRLNNDGSVTLLQRTNKKSHEFYNTQGQYLFEISEKLEPRKDWSNLSGDFQKEIAWSIAKVGLQVNVNDNLASYMKVRAEEVGWDAMPGLNMLDKLGHHNRNMLGVDALVSFTRIPYNQSTREGKPSSLIGLIPYIKTIDAFYPFLNSGRDLQYDIIHPKSLIDATYSIEGTSIWERIKEIYQQGLNNTLYKLNHMYYYNK